MAVAACGPRDSGPPRFEVRDSAGVEIVRSGPGNDAEARGWRIPENPELQIGGGDGDSAYGFKSISGALRLSDGRIVVTEPLSMNIRVFGRDGVHERSFGRSGSGPTDFGSPPVLALREPDTLVVWDGSHARLSCYDPAGHLLSQRSHASAVAALPMTPGVRGWQVDADGSVLWAGPASSRLRTGIRTAQRSVALIDGPTGEVEDLGVYPLGRELMLDVGVSFVDWFAPASVATLGPRPLRVAISSPEEWEIRFFDSGGALRRILRAPVARVPLTSQARAQRREYLSDWAQLFRLPRSKGEEVDDRLPVPDSIPAIADLRWDRSGNLWVGRRVPDPEETELFDVFDADGRWLSTVHFPPERGHVLEIGEDYVLAAWADDLGVPYLRVYRLRKPDSGDPLPPSR